MEPLKLFKITKKTIPCHNPDMKYIISTNEEKARMMYSNYDMDSSYTFNFNLIKEFKFKKEYLKGLSLYCFLNEKYWFNEKFESLFKEKRQGELWNSFYYYSDEEIDIKDIFNFQKLKKSHNKKLYKELLEIKKDIKELENEFHKKMFEINKFNKFLGANGLKL